MVDAGDLVFADDLLKKSLIHVVDALVILLLSLHQDHTRLLVELHKDCNLEVIFLTGHEVPNLDVSQEANVLKDAHIYHRPIEGDEHDSRVLVVSHSLDLVQALHIDKQ